MITINLLPENLREQRSGLKLEKIPFLPIIFLVVAVVLFAHILLGMAGIYKRIQTISLNRQWQKAQPKLQEIEKIKSDLRKKDQQVALLENILKRDFYWSTLLSKINKAVPQGLWLRQLNIQEDSFTMEGSVFNFGLDEIALLNTFFNDLKGDSFFENNLKNFDLTSVRRRKIKNYEIIDFLLSAEIKGSEIETE